ncbi:MAG: C4-type zinc ribbon domain-containing protein [Deltaproteobacteria bacterium]|mgnify:CR=1 FL=1
MLKDLEILKELQRVDTQIDSLIKDKTDSPLKIQSLNSRLQDELKRAEEKRQSLRSLEQKKKSLELDLREGEDKLKKGEERMMSLKSNEEYQAMQKEMEHFRHANLLIEGQILEVMLTLDEANEGLREFEEDLASRKRAIESEIKTVEQNFSQIDTLLKDRQKEREEIVKGLTADIVSTYKRLRSRLSLAVTETRRGKCAECHMEIPPQLYNLIHRGEAMHLCPNCHRIIIFSGQP